MSVYRLDENNFEFPKYADDENAIAIGGIISTETLIKAYSNGVFPYYYPDEEISWWRPLNRYVIFPKNIRISHSMKRVFNQKTFEVTFNKNFCEIIHKCREKRKYTEDGTWINDDIETTYNKLFEKGYAFSVEVWKNDKLAGGLYGVKLGKCLFGESMYYDITNASKVAVISLAEKALAEKYLFIDCQFYTRHLESLGGQFISNDEFLSLIDKGTKYIH